MSVVETLIATYKKAVYEKDAGLLISIYGEKVLLFDQWDEWSMTGVEAWRAAATGWFESLGSERVIADFESVTESASDNLLVATGFQIFTAVSSEGARLRSKRERFTWAMTNDTGAWKIVHAHNSSPIDPQTGQPRTQ